MTGKAKPKKHTAKEIQAKIDAALTNRGGGKAGIADRTGKKKGDHAKFEYPSRVKKHPKIPYEESKLVNLHAVLAPVAESKPKPGIRGSLKK
ncbi:hypothetical protein BRARA_E03560 [Brassica rapa]|uniref:Uncharacterized protein n=1 Tax=Brassica campestris TaxID=3711 RepID=A0A397ZI40_BRACM|nr:hypothetical protein BRARA_E03560 [Brassica rapa]